MTTTKKKTVRKRVRANDRHWRRDLMARDIFIALVVREPKPLDSAATLADTALFAAATFERHRAEWRGK